MISKEWIAFFIDSDNISPILDSFIGTKLKFEFGLLNIISGLSFFQNLKKYPTNKADKIWEINKIYPRCLFLNKAIPNSS